MECIPSKKHVCITCNKEYTTRQNLWKHNKKFHVIVTNIVAPIITNTSSESKIIAPNVTNIAPKNECKYCKNVFSRNSSLKRHYDRCKEKDTKETSEVTQLKEFYEKKIEEIKKQMLDLIKKSCKIHPKTLQKINNQLNNSNNNNTINNTYIVQFGREKLYEVFSKKEQIDVLNCGNLCLENLIEKAHFNSKYPQFKNILITNLQNNLAYKYNAATSNFDVVTKKELLEDIISERMYDIEEFFNNYKDDITPKMQMVIENFIKKMDGESYEDLKKQNIKIILYNNRSLVDKANFDIIV